MLSKGLRDEKKEEIDRALDAIQEIGFVPDLWSEEQRRLIDEKLQKHLDLTFDKIKNISSEELLENLKSKNLEFAHFEKFADILMESTEVEDPEYEQILAQHAIAVYEAAQKESKTFSFGLMQKISTAKTYL